MTKPRVAVLGLGIMGGGMATRLLSHGFPLSVYNRSRERATRLAKAGAFVASSPRQAAERAELVLSMVADDTASRSIWLGRRRRVSWGRPGHCTGRIKHVVGRLDQRACSRSGGKEM